MNPIKLIFFAPALAAATYCGGDIFFDTYAPIKNQDQDIKNIKQQKLKTTLNIVQNTASQKEDLEKSTIVIDKKIVESEKKIKIIGQTAIDATTKIVSEKTQLNNLLHDLFGSGTNVPPPNTTDLKGCFEELLRDRKQKENKILQILKNDPETKKLYSGQNFDQDQYIAILMAWIFNNASKASKPVKKSSYSNYRLLLKDLQEINAQNKNLDLQDKNDLKKYEIYKNTISDQTRLLENSKKSLVKEKNNKKDLQDIYAIKKTSLNKKQQQWINDTDSMIFMESHLSEF